jgi:hypothetical protein
MCSTGRIVPQSDVTLQKELLMEYIHDHAGELREKLDGVITIHRFDVDNYLVKSGVPKFTDLEWRNLPDLVDEWHLDYISSQVYFITNNDPERSGFHD